MEIVRLGCSAVQIKIHTDVCIFINVCVYMQAFVYNCFCVWTAAQKFLQLVKIDNVHSTAAAAAARQ